MKTQNNLNTTEVERLAQASWEEEKVIETTMLVIWENKAQGVG